VSLLLFVLLLSNVFALRKNRWPHPRFGFCAAVAPAACRDMAEQFCKTNGGSSSSVLVCVVMPRSTGYNVAYFMNCESSLMTFGTNESPHCQFTINQKAEPLDQ
jgi:hypothetical protein